MPRYVERAGFMHPSMREKIIIRTHWEPVTGREQRRVIIFSLDGNVVDHMDLHDHAKAWRVFMRAVRRSAFSKRSTFRWLSHYAVEED